jgi:hypothetical protein
MRRDTVGFANGFPHTGNKQIRCGRDMIIFSHHPCHTIIFSRHLVHGILGQHVKVLFIMIKIYDEYFAIHVSDMWVALFNNHYM